jgi:hypothetical protein
VPNKSTVSRLVNRLHDTGIVHRWTRWTIPALNVTVLFSDFRAIYKNRSVRNVLRYFSTILYICPTSFSCRTKYLRSNESDSYLKFFGGFWQWLVCFLAFVSVFWCMHNPCYDVWSVGCASLFMSLVALKWYTVYVCKYRCGNWVTCHRNRRPLDILFIYLFIDWAVFFPYIDVPA